MPAQRISNSGILAAMVGVAGIEVLSGFALVPSYFPTASKAYSAVTEYTNSPVFGFLRNLHHWASAVLIIFGALYILVGLFTGAYQKPNQWLWIESIALFLLGIGMQITGHLLPFDQQAVRTAVVETGIAADAPVVGAMQAHLMRGGDSVGEPTLHLWYIAHVLAFTVLLCALLGLIYGTARNIKISLKQPAWIFAGIVISIGMAIALKAPLGHAATPADYGDSGARPEWYIIPLHSLLTLFQDTLKQPAFIGTMVIPGLAVAFLLLLPWLHRKDTIAPSRILGALGTIALVALTMYSIADVAPPVGNQIVAITDAGYPGTPTKLNPKTIAQGRQLFTDQGCDNCHVINGKGAKVGPDLSYEGSKGKSLDWHVKHIQNPKSTTPGSTMPAFKDLKDAEYNALAQYVMSLKKK